MKKEEIQELISQEYEKIDAANSRIEELQKVLNKEVTDYTGKFIYHCNSVNHIYMYIEKQRVDEETVVFEGFQINHLLFLNPSLCSITFAENGHLTFKLDNFKAKEKEIRIITQDNFLRVYNNLINSLQSKVEKFSNQK